MTRYLPALLAILCACSSRGGVAASGSGGSSSAGSDAGAATADAGSAPAPFRSGSRLLARVYREAAAAPEATAPTLIGWFDTLLEVDCRFQMGTDGRYRCFPDEELITLNSASSGCEPDQLAAMLPTDTPCSSRLVSKVDWNGDCSGEQPATAGRLGAPLGTGSSNLLAYRYFPSTGGCVPSLEGMPGYAYSFCEFEPLAPETFVGAEEQTRRVGDVEQVTLEADDGSMQLMGLRHPELGVGLYPRRGQLVPQLDNFGSDSAPMFTVFGDPQCQVPVLYLPGTCVPAVYLELGCQPGEVRRLGSEPATAFFGIDPTGACGRHPDSISFLENETLNGGAHYPVEGALPAIDYSERRVAYGRLSTLWIEHAGELVARVPELLFDTELETECLFDTQDGTARCEPTTSWAWAPLFSDEACQQVVGYRYDHTQDFSACEVPASYARIDDGFARMRPTTGTVPAALFQNTYQAPDPSGATGPCMPWTGPVELFTAEPVEDSQIAELVEGVQ